MGFFLCKLKDTKLGIYFGHNTMMSIADNGAFNTEVSKSLEKYVEKHENIYACVDKNGVEHFLNVLKSGNCVGRDISLLIDEVSQNYMDGFMVRG